MASTPGSSKTGFAAPLQTTALADQAKWSNALQKWSEQVVRPIEFFGKVLDEASKPVAGAQVSCSYNRFALPEGSFEISTVSDTNGLFSISGIRGSTLAVRVWKQGYYPSKAGVPESFNYMSVNGTEPFQADPRNPVIFHLRRRGIGAKLIASQNGFAPVITISGLGNGIVKRVDFFHRTSGDQGQMEVSAVKPAAGEPSDHWSFRLSIPDGGLVECSDEPPYEAPESGYAPLVEYHFQAGETNWTESLDKSFYIAFGNPRRFGRIHVQTTISTGVILQYAINPDGSRNLEPVEAGRQAPAVPWWAPPGTKAVIPKFK